MRHRRDVDLVLKSHVEAQPAPIAIARRPESRCAFSFERGSYGTYNLEGAGRGVPLEPCDDVEALNAVRGEDSRCGHRLAVEVVDQHRLETVQGEVVGEQLLGALWSGGRNEG